MKKVLLILSGVIFFSAISFAQKNPVPVQDNNGKYGYAYDQNSAFIIAPKYDDAHYFFEGLAAVRIGDNWGFINNNGAMVIPAKYSSVSDFYEGMAKVSTEVKEGAATYDKCGFVNKAGTVVIPLKFYNAGGFNDAGLCDVAVKDNQGNIKWGFINKTGTMVVAAKYDSLGNVSGNGYQVVVAKNKIGFVNKKGIEVIPPAYDTKYYANNDYDFQDGLAVALLNGKRGMIDEKGKVAIPFKYDELHIFRDSLAVASSNHKWGFVNKAGVEVIPLQYTSETDFSSGTSLVVKDNGEKWTIDRTGKELKLVFKAEVMDSTIFSGVYNGRNSYINFKFDCQSNGICVIITANDKSHKFPGIGCEMIDISRLGIKKGDEIKATVINRKGCGVTMQAGGAIDNGSSKSNNQGKMKLKLFGR